MRTAMRAAANAAMRAPGVKQGVQGARQAYVETRKAAEARFERFEREAWAWINKMQEEARNQARQAQRRIEARDHAAILGVPADANIEAIKKAYRLKMRSHHPDKFANDPSAEARAHAESQRIIEAYQQLSALHTGRETRRQD
jgi:preprotein translocase subunit Sec63